VSLVNLLSKLLLLFGCFLGVVYYDAGDLLDEVEEGDVDKTWSEAWFQDALIG
jgi:hypothetical protein